VVATRVFVATRDHRVLRLEERNGAWTATQVLEGVSGQAVSANDGRVLVGTHGDGCYLSLDGGGGWRRVALPELEIFSVAISAADGTLYAGSEPSRLFVSRDGEHWEELESLQDIPSRPQWSFPPRPWTHHVRWIAPDPHRAERLLVGIELGGLMYSDDGGATFTDHRPGAKRDTHAIAWHPRREGVAYQAAGDGAAVSHDGGLTWDSADGGRDLSYCWALVPDPIDEDRWYVSAASGPRAAHAGATAHGRLYRWSDRWQPLPLPGESMPYALAALDDALFVGMADGQILQSRDGGETWSAPFDRIGSIVAMSASVS
jgi:photosystem II stability/assembly factor-like uncharacterized protein